MFQRALQMQASVTREICDSPSVELSRGVRDAAANAARLRRLAAGSGAIVQFGSSSSRSADEGANAPAGDEPMQVRQKGPLAWLGPPALESPHHTLVRPAEHPMAVLGRKRMYNMA
jgi:hypothetical protein